MMRASIAGRALIVSVLCAGLSGCITMQNFTASDLRKPEYRYKTEVLDMDIQHVSKALFDYQTNCRALGAVSTAPDDSRIVITQDGMGLTKLSIYLVVDLVSAGKQTKFDSYTYYSTWHSHVDDILNAITHPGKCA